MARTGIVSAGPASGAGSGETVELYVTLPEGATEGAEVGCHIPEGIPGAGGYFVLKVERGWKPGLRVVQRIRVQYASENAPEVTGGSESAAVSDSHSLSPLPPDHPLTITLLDRIDILLRRASRPLQTLPNLTRTCWRALVQLPPCLLPV